MIVDTSVGVIGDAYFIRAAMCAATIAGVPDNFDITAMAVLRYVATGSTPTTSPPSSTDWADSTNNDTTCYDFADANLVPAEPINPPRKAIGDVILVSNMFVTTLESFLTPFLKNSQAGNIANANNVLIPHFFWNSVTWTNVSGTWGANADTSLPTSMTVYLPALAVHSPEW